MKHRIIKIAKSPFTAAGGMFVLLIFIASMRHPSAKDKTFSYLALGDSYTIGEKVSAPENFPNQVHAILETKGLAFKQPVIIAETGWTTDELEDAIVKEKPQARFDFVTLLIGVNNQYRGRKVTEYSKEFESLLKRAIEFAGNDASHVIVLSIPDWGQTPFAAGRDRNKIGRDIDAYNKVNRKIAVRYKVNYINITPETRKAAEDPTLLAQDGLHPSGREYAKWADQVAAVIEKNL